jgi:multiple sugar transport system permease protein
MSAAPAIPRKAKMTGRERREAWEAAAFLSPWIIGFVLFTGGPIVASLVMSFFRWDPSDLNNPTDFIGLANYREMLRDERVALSLYNTVVYAVLYIPSAIAVALALAMLLNQKLPGMRFFRTILYLPTLTQGVATFVLWRIVYDADDGPLNRFLGLFMSHPPGWLIDPAWSKPAIVLMNLWGVGGMMLIFLAGLQNIPRQLYEAAAIDGAGTWRQFTHVTLPMLTPTILLNMIMATIGAFKVFEAAYILTGGGPARSTLFYAYYVFNRAFVYFNMGYASAMAWLLFVIILVLTSIQLRYSRKWVQYG